MFADQKRKRERRVTEEQKEKLEAIAVQVHRVEELLGSPGWARGSPRKKFEKKKRKERR